MSTADLEKALEAYAKALEALEKPDQPPSPETYLDVLIARDEIQICLAEQGPSAKKVLPTLSSLDDRFKQQREVVARTVPLGQWREMVDPPASAWWWRFELPKSVHPWDKLDWLWEILTIPMLTVNFALVVAISSRFLAGGPDAIGAFAVIGQSVAAMFAAGAPWTRAGQQLIERSLKALHLPKYLWHEAKLAIAFTVLLGLLGLQAALPSIARVYVRRGIDAQYARQTTSAFEEYKRAIELDPDNREAHLRLGKIYEDLRDIDQARAEYRIALMGGCIEAYNNLAHLYIVEDKDYAAAAILLREGQSQLESRDNIDVIPCYQEADLKELLEESEYAFHKNLGWARLMQNRLTESENQLKAAIALKKKKAAPHCLLAQVLERRDNEDTSSALPEWRKCNAYGSELIPDEDRWLGMARQRLSQSVPDEPEEKPAE